MQKGNTGLLGTFLIVMAVVIGATILVSFADGAEKKPNPDLDTLVISLPENWEPAPRGLPKSPRYLHAPSGSTMDIVILEHKADLPKKAVALRDRLIQDGLKPSFLTIEPGRISLVWEEDALRRKATFKEMDGRDLIGYFTVNWTDKKAESRVLKDFSYFIDSARYE